MYFIGTATVGLSMIAFNYGRQLESNGMQNGDILSTLSGCLFIYGSIIACSVGGELMKRSVSDVSEINEGLITRNILTASHLTDGMILTTGTTLFHRLILDSRESLIN